ELVDRRGGERAATERKARRTSGARRAGARVLGCTAPAARDARDPPADQRDVRQQHEAERALCAGVPRILGAARAVAAGGSVMTLSLEDLADLIDGRLPWPQVKAIVSAPKDDDRFQRLLGIL